MRPSSFGCINSAREISSDSGRSFEFAPSVGMHTYALAIIVYAVVGVFDAHVLYVRTNHAILVLAGLCNQGGKIIIDQGSGTQDLLGRHCHTLLTMLWLNDSIV